MFFPIITKHCYIRNAGFTSRGFKEDDFLSYLYCSLGVANLD